MGFEAATADPSGVGALDVKHVIVYIDDEVYVELLE